MTEIDPGSLSEMAHFPQQYTCIKFVKLLLLDAVNKYGKSNSHVPVNRLKKKR